MTRITRRALIAVALVLGTLAGSWPLAGPAAAKPETETGRELSRGTRLVVGDCPFEDTGPPAADVRCETWIVWWTQSAWSTQGHPDIDDAPWRAFVEHYVDLAHSDGTDEQLVAEWGDVNGTGTYDARHLRYAHLDAVAVPMFEVDEHGITSTPTGNTVHLDDFDWTAVSGTYVWGSDGPLFDGNRHVRLPCGHVSFLAHQKLTVGYVTGSIDGRSIDEYFQQIEIEGVEPADGTGYIFDNAFQIHEVDRCAS